jgi:hypothetical protein
LNHERFNLKAGDRLAVVSRANGEISLDTSGAHQGSGGHPEDSMQAQIRAIEARLAR